jgi:hypothetical protein
MLKKIGIITAIIVAIILIGLTAIYITQRQEGEEMRREERVATTPKVPEQPTIQPEEPVTQPETPTDWKIYKGEKWGWMIKYPPELVGLERSDKDMGLRYYSDPKTPEFIQFQSPFQDPSEPWMPYSFKAQKYLGVKGVGWVPVKCDRRA